MKHRETSKGEPSLSVVKEQDVPVLDVVSQYPKGPKDLIIMYLGCR